MLLTRTFENHVILGMLLISEGGLYSRKYSNFNTIKSPHRTVTASFMYKHWFHCHLKLYWYWCHYMAVIWICDPWFTSTPAIISDSAVDTAEMLCGSGIMKGYGLLSVLMTVTCNVTIVSLLSLWDLAMTVLNDSLFRDLLNTWTGTWSGHNVFRWCGRTVTVDTTVQIITGLFTRRRKQVL